jgi:hypothetical protein
MMDKVREWFRWQIALLLDRFSDTCWAELVMWAQFSEHHEFGEISDIRNTAGHCGRMGETAYCGKCLAENSP